MHTFLNTLQALENAQQAGHSNRVMSAVDTKSNDSFDYCQSVRTCRQRAHACFNGCADGITELIWMVCCCKGCCCKFVDEASWLDYDEDFSWSGGGGGDD